MKNPYKNLYTIIAIAGLAAISVTITSSRSLAMTQGGFVNEAKQAGNYPGARETGDKTTSTGGGHGQVKENSREVQLVAPALNGGNAIQVATPQGINDSAPGWRVSVGIFTKVEQIESITSLLDGSGFDAHSTRVTIASGTAEATLVWLGPYVERETAEKVSTLLIILTGEKGYVTRRAFCEHC